MKKDLLMLLRHVVVQTEQSWPATFAQVNERGLWRLPLRD